MYLLPILIGHNGLSASVVIDQSTYFGFGFTASSILKTALSITQSEVKSKPNVTYSHAFSRTWRRLHVFLRVFIGSLDCQRLLCLAGLISLVLVLKHSIENCSIPTIGDNVSRIFNRLFLLSSTPRPNFVLACYTIRTLCALGH